LKLLTTEKIAIVDMWVSCGYAVAGFLSSGGRVAITDIKKYPHGHLWTVHTFTFSKYFT
jgi:hypothetical protein